MGKEIKVRIIMRYNSTEGWNTVENETTILSKGEIGLEYISDSAIPKMKIGNGLLSWNNLPYFETKLPDNFTWGNLRGTPLQTETIKTKNLELTKPGFLDVVNIVTLNKNFDKIDSKYKEHSNTLLQLGKEISELLKIAEQEFPEGSIETEILDARTRYASYADEEGNQINLSYDTLGEALRAIDKDLQDYKNIVDEIVQDLLMPSSLELNESGQIYLIDKEGNQIGEAVAVKDPVLELQVQTLDTNVQILDSKVKNNLIEIGDLKDKISKLPSTFPNNLIYEENKLYLAVGDEKIENSMVEITGGGGGGSETSYKIELTSTEREISKPLGEQIILTYNYLSYDKEDSTINDGPGSGELLIDNIQRATFLVNQGLNTLDVTKYLSAGANSLKIKTTNSEGSSKTLQFNVMLLSLTISSSFPKISYQKSGILPISYTVNSETEFSSHFILTKQGAISGEDYYNPTEIFTETFSKGTTSTAYLKPIPSGSYLLEIFAQSGEVKSNSLVLGLIIYTSSDSMPFIVMVPEKTTFKQGEIVSIPYLIYDPNDTAPDIIFSIYSLNENTQEKNLYYSETIKDVGRSIQELTSQRYPEGKTIFEIAWAADTDIKNSVTLTIEESDVSLELFSENLVFEFDPINKTNQNSAGKWSYEDKETGEIKEAIFSGIDWGTLDGWQVKKDKNGKPLEDQTMLRILPGGSMTIPFYPFKEEIVNNNLGYTIEIELATQNVTDYDSLILNIFDDTEGIKRGLRVLSQSAELKSQNNIISAQFKEDERVRLTFTIEPNTLNNLIMIYINGVLCGIKQYETDAFRQENACPIIIGAEDSGIDVYFIRAYKRVLDEQQQLNNFCVDRASLGERISAKTRNDILNNSANGDLSKIITINSLKGAIPYIIMHCPKLPANKDQDKFKGMKMTFVDPANPSRSFTAENCTFSVQGTSSAGYPVKNFKIKLDKKTGIVYTRNGQVDLDGFYFEGKENSQPTKVFCLKADYASSENANNVMLVDYYNQTNPYRNVAQDYQVKTLGQKETVRHGIHGEPIVLFWQNTNTNEIYFQGKYNFNDDKDAEEVFGYVGVLPEDTFNIQCWEFTNNNMNLCLFKHNLTEGDAAWFKEVEEDGEMIPAWANSFERRFPEQEDDVVPDLTAFRRVVDWVASTNPDWANDEKKLPNAFYYRTLDKKYDPNKKEKYYKKNNDGSFSSFTIVEEDTAEPYNSQINLDLTLFKNLINQIQTQTRPIDLIFTKKADSTWKVFYLENQQEHILLSDLQTLGTYGILFEKDADPVESFSIKIYSGNNWTSQLYEYHTHDTASYRLAKFKNEFEDYFILDAMAYYYVFTETVLLMDNRAKNMFLVSFDIDSKLIYDKNGKIIGCEKQPTGTYGHWAPTPYDMDSALGINNEGELVYGYHLEDTGEDGKVFTGQDSVLWNNFRDCFQTEIADMYLQIRGQSGSTKGSMPFSYESLSDKMNNHQSVWPEVVWNVDQKIKYLTPFYNGTDHLAMAQGDKRAQRNFWLYNAFKYRDSKYSAGDALESKAILFRLNGPGTFKIVPYSNIYTRVKFGNAKDTKQRTLRDQVAEFSTEGISSIYDLETYIYSADRISSIGDLSDFHIGLCNFANANKLKEIILGREEEGYTNPYLKNFRAGESTVLREVNLSNCTELKMEIGLSGCPNLQIFKARGSAITGVSFARGARLHTCYLPNTIALLSLLDLNYLTSEGLQIETNEKGKYTFSSLRIENCNQLPFYELIMNAENLKYLRLRNLEWHTILGDENSSELCFMKFYEKIKTLKGLDENNGEMPDKYPQISGRIYLTEQISAELLEEINNYFPELIIIVNDKPQYFLTYVNDDNKVLFRYIADEGSKPLDPTKDDIAGVDKDEILKALEKAEEDKFANPPAPEGEADTRYIFSGWSMPEKVTSSLIVRPKYREQYLVKFFDAKGTHLEELNNWVFKGENVPDPREQENPYFVIKEPDAEFSYNHSGWDQSLINLQAPMNFYPVFSTTRNIYTVLFYTNLPEPIGSREVPYGEKAEDLDDSLKKYYFEGDKNRPSELHIFEKWNSDTSGIEGLTITPQNYQTEPIIMEASFIFTGDRNDTHWKYIALVAAAGNREVEITADNCVDENDIGKVILPLHISSTKDVYFDYNGQQYTVTMELVAQNFDQLAEPSDDYNQKTDRAAFTFIAQSIPFQRTFNSKERLFNFPILDEEGNVETYVEALGWTGGGWKNSELWSWTNGDFLSSLEQKNPGLSEALQLVIKVSDIGRPTDTELDLRVPNQKTTSNDWIWIPSVTELGIDADSGTQSIMDEQSSMIDKDGTYLCYPWFTNDNSRIKNFNGIPSNYWTRTHLINLTFRFVTIIGTGAKGDEVCRTPQGFVFGFCV